MAVAVVGLGAFGLVALKNLKEVGCNVTGFDKNPYVGGVWKYTESQQTQGTVVNISKERGCFTDFPFPDDWDSHCSAAQVHEYLAAFAEHFNLGSHIQRGVDVRSVTRDSQQSKWVLSVVRSTSTKPESLLFDKVIIATGANSRPNIPVLAGADLFKGQILHSRDFKRPSDFKNKRVIVVGIGNSAADTSTSLVGIADKIYLSHRHGVLLMPRKLPNGTSLDHSLTYRKSTILSTLQRYLPRQAESMMNKMLLDVRNTAFTMRPEWRLDPAPSVANVVPTISDTLVPALESGDIESVDSIKEILGGSSVQLADGKLVEVDTIIFCTGYHVDYSVVGEFDPFLDTRHTDLSDDATKQSEPPADSPSDPARLNPPIPRLYQNLLSLAHPDSLAFLGTAASPAAAFPLADLATMAIAQFWKPDPQQLPSRAEMNAWVRSHLAWAESIRARGPFNTRLVFGPDWEAWTEKIAGTRVSEHLGYGPTGWAFWAKDRKFCNLLMDGLYSPHLYRLFDSGGRRKAWDGAREAIIKANESTGRTAK
ncbi:hypothetical protein DV738_g4246, partial [Chaetothyriales sp. CBS 135597]